METVITRFQPHLASDGTKSMMARKRCLCGCDGGKTAELDTHATSPGLLRGRCKVELSRLCVSAALWVHLVRTG